MSVLNPSGFFNKKPNLVPPYYWPTICDAANLSLDVYYGALSNERKPLPPGWLEFSRYECDGYVGVCYVRNAYTAAGPDCVAFAHRGTVFNFQILKADLEVALEKTPALLSKAQIFVSHAIENLIKTFGNRLENAEWIQTGHSLGGIFAELFSGGRFRKTITFENPGSKPILEKIFYEQYTQAGLPEKQIKELIAKRLDIIQQTSQIYLAGVNFINSCNEQAGTVWRLSDLPCDYDIYKGGPMRPILAQYWLNPYYLYYTYDQHRIENICNYLKNKGAIMADTNPCGFKAGYAAYLDGQARKKYWDKYFELLWQRSPDLREEYQNDFKHYCTIFFDKLKQVQREASITPPANETQKCAKENFFMHRFLKFKHPAPLPTLEHNLKTSHLKQC